MIVVSNTVAQTIAPGADMIFNTTISKTGKGQCHRAGSPSVKLCNGIHMITFSANIAGAASSPLQLSLANGGEVIPFTAMDSVSGATDDYRQVSISVPLKQCCCDFDRITVRNTGTNAINVAANPMLSASRMA